MPSTAGQQKATVREALTGFGAQDAELEVLFQNVAAFVKERNLAVFMQRITFLEIHAGVHQNTWSSSTDAKDKLKLLYDIKHITIRKSNI